MSKGQLNALRHYWLVSQVGKGLADWREGNKSAPFLKGLLTSDDDPVDYWNNAIADKFIKDRLGLVFFNPEQALQQAADTIQNLSRTRKTKYPWKIYEN